jgi:ketosteroid isomerase-like protein
MKPNKYLIVVAISILLMTATSYGQSAQKAVEEVQKKFIAALEKGDVSFVSQLYTKDAQVFSPMQNQPIAGKAALEKDFNDFSGVVKSEKLKVELREIEVEQHGNTAHSVGTYKETRPDGKTFDEGRFISIWKQQGGTWKLHRHLWHSTLKTEN